MNDSNQLAKRQENQRNDIALTDQAVELAKRLKYMVSGGQHLTDVEILAWAHYSVANGLDAAAQESYYLPGVGPVTGVVAYRRRAQEELEREAQLANLGFAEFNIVYELVEPGEAVFDPKKGDLAVRAVLTDTLSSKLWRDSLFGFAKELREIGMEPAVAYDEAKKMCKPEPRWTAIAVVYAVEGFTKDGKPEKWDRHERVMKRADKLVIKKRFPRIKLPEDGESNQLPEGMNITIERPTQAALESGDKPKHTEAENMRDLGYDPEPEPTTQATGEVRQPEFYTGPLAFIGKKNKYPVAWVKEMMPKIVGAGLSNEYELDGILQKMAMEVPNSTLADVAVGAVEAYLNGKKAGMEDPMVAVHDFMVACTEGQTENG